MENATLYNHIRLFPGFVIPLVPRGCGAGFEETLPGTLEWDRVAVLTEAAEPVVELRVQEGGGQGGAAVAAPRRS